MHLPASHTLQLTAMQLLHMGTAASVYVPVCGMHTHPPMALAAVAAMIDPAAAASFPTVLAPTALAASAANLGMAPILWRGGEGVDSESWGRGASAASTSCSSALLSVGRVGECGGKAVAAWTFGAPGRYLYVELSTVTPTGLWCRTCNTGGAHPCLAHTHHGGNSCTCSRFLSMHGVLPPDPVGSL
jgi:hypothetical protein